MNPAMPPLPISPETLRLPLTLQVAWWRMASESVEQAAALSREGIDWWIGTLEKLSAQGAER